MKKFFITIFLLTFGIYFSQLSEISKIDKEVSKKFGAIQKKYKKEFPQERSKEEAEVYAYKTSAYRKAIENIQSNEVKVDLNSIPKDYTKEAEFETGIAGFRKLFAENFDTSSLDGSNGTVKSLLMFLIDENGKVSNVNADGNDVGFNQEAILTIYRIIDKIKFKPAEKDGVPVKSVFRLPLTMNFE